ncbi:MAG TPA: SDR family oxidoreductase [Lentimicrobium sp.]|nr:SDR family oxidoreductase [Lentimicrobium sp.]
MEKTVLITGTTSGIGRSCALRFAKEGHKIIITGRRKERLESIAADLTRLYNSKVCILSFDVTKRDQVDSAISNLPEEFRMIDVLVNNAGLALGLKPIHEGEPEQWETMIDTNIKGLLFMTHAVVPLMVENGHGHVINIGSIAGREAYSSGNVYCATKAAVDSLTKAMRIDLVTKNIKVTQVAPGAVETEFSMVRFAGNEEAAKAVYKGYDPLTPDDVAEVVHYVTTLPAHVNINDLLIMPTAQASASVIHRRNS